MELEVPESVGCGHEPEEEACLQQGLQGLLALLLGGGHVEAARIDDLIGHVNLGLLDVVAHQGLDAVCVRPLRRPPCPALLQPSSQTLRGSG